MITPAHTEPTTPGDVLIIATWLVVFALLAGFISIVIAWHEDRHIRRLARAQRRTRTGRRPARG